MLSTIHSAKGREWDAVHVLNVADGNFPVEYATGKAALIEEERRLLYVAMTRAVLSCFREVTWPVGNADSSSAAPRAPKVDVAGMLRGMW